MGSCIKSHSEVALNTEIKQVKTSSYTQNFDYEAGRYSTKYMISVQDEKGAGWSKIYLVHSDYQIY